MNITLVRTMLLIVCWALAGPALAQSTAYPDRPIRLIVPYPAGGSNDIIARIFANKLGEELGQSVVVDNRPGGGTALGTSAAARSAPDGYTLVMGSLASHATGPHLNRNAGYDAVKDFAPVTLLAVAPIILVVSNDFPASNAKEFVSLLKKSPGKYNYASAGNGSPPHLAAEIFKSQTGTQMVHIPYKGGTAHLVDLQAGRVDLIFDTSISSMAFIKSGKVRPLAIAAPKRSAEIPDVPTFAESGVPGFELNSWYGILVPAGTPKPVIEKLNAAFVRIAGMPDVREQLAKLSIEPRAGTPEAFGAMIDAELARYGKAIRDAGIKPE